MNTNHCIHETKFIFWVPQPVGKRPLRRLRIPVLVVLTIGLGWMAGMAWGLSAGETEGGRISRARFLMGTVFQFEAPVGKDAEATGQALEKALDEVARLETVLSNWDTDSELSQMNREASDREVVVSADLYRAVDSAIFWAAESQGAFDPAVEPLTRGARQPSRRPSEREIRPGNWTGVQLDPSSSRISFSAGAKGIDLGGIGKGYALDRAAEMLQSQGVRAALLDAGGQLLALGAPPGEEGWMVAVSDPERRDRAALPLLLRDVSVATSGNAERPGEIVDPETGATMLGAWSATAIAADATAADAISTALFVMGPEEGINWARMKEELLALYLVPSPQKGTPASLRSSRDLPRSDSGLVQISSAPVGRRRVVRVQR